MSAATTGPADPSRPAEDPDARAPRDGHAGTALRDALDRGMGADKIAFPDPATAPLETDAEAGGAPTDPQAARAGLAQEMRAPGATPGPVTAWGPLTGAERFRGFLPWAGLAVGGGAAALVAAALLGLAA